MRRPRVRQDDWLAWDVQGAQGVGLSGRPLEVGGFMHRFAHHSGRFATGHGRAIAPSRFHALMTVIDQISSASSTSLKCLAASSKTSSRHGAVG